MKNIAGPNSLPDPQTKRRTVRSFVLREGRLTRGQQRAIDQWWPEFGLANSNHPLDFDKIFTQAGPVHLEIGFGMGEALAFSAAQMPTENFLGAEVHRPGIGTLLRRIAEQQLSNVRIVCTDAVQLLNDRVTANSLSSVRLYFPDPWPKKRHHKRRIIQPDFVQAVTVALQPGGLFHLATDWEPYAEQMMETVSAHPLLVNLAGPENFASRPQWRSQTKFETRGLKLGHGVSDLLFEKQAEGTSGT